MLCSARSSAHAGLVALAIFGLLAGCASTPASTPAADSATVDLRQTLPKVGVLDEPREPELLLWGHEEGGPFATYRVSADGAMLGVENGIFIATARGEWGWTVEEKPARTLSCHQNVEKFDEEGGKVLRAVAALRDGSHPQVVVSEAIPPSDDAGPFEQSVSLLGSLGPYLFVQERVTLFGCGKNLRETVAFRVWDLEGAVWNGWRTELTGVPALQQEVRSKLDERLDDLRDDDPRSIVPELTQFRPSYGASGRLGFQLLFTRPTLESYHDTQWSFPSESMELASEGLPERFAAWSQLPAGITRFLAAHPRIFLDGWSTR
ncbi:hypothetical protein [Chondromyces crocatus]|uniref:Uncharacterized protein n=1 Tax=Chondromyces crocatus TaxID=52 RepID=A0A0K1EL28_CHOCO|nr:hypothetical protein [Chondromyces crocatus]AKT41541.1 uncharacterized protein CMC5_057480 [Chondromyces crocatus]